MKSPLGTESAVGPCTGRQVGSGGCCGDDGCCGGVPAYLPIRPPEPDARSQLFHSEISETSTWRAMSRFRLGATRTSRRHVSSPPANHADIWRGWLSALHRDFDRNKQCLRLGCGQRSLRRSTSRVRSAVGESAVVVRRKTALDCVFGGLTEYRPILINDDRR